MGFMIKVTKAGVERFSTKQDFIIARGAKNDVDVVVCEVTDGTHIGRGEGTPIYYEGETAELCVDAINMRAKQNRPITREDLLDSMMEGAARNALDAALWDLEVKATGKPLWQLAGLPAPQALQTAFTISLNDPAIMESEAKKAAANGYGLLKLKLDENQIIERVAAVRKGAPNARLIVDANESWDELDILDIAHALHGHDVELIEQPVSAGFEDELMALNSPILLCADESCHTSEDIERVDGCFQAVNIKLDKTGGLTEALRLAKKAQENDLAIMVGCMLSSSLGVAPAFALAGLANWVDLDGSALLKKDREGGFTFDNGQIIPPA